MVMKEILIELDERRRASFGRVGRPEHTRYLAHAEDDGTIIMRPVDLVPAVVGERPAMLEDLAEGMRELREMRARTDRRVIEPSFSQPPQAHEGGDW
jgi:hypothetical protein